MGMQTTVMPIACSFRSPEFVILPRSGAKGTAASNAIIIGGNLFSSSNKKLPDTRHIANTEGHTTCRSFRSPLSSMYWGQA